MPSEYMIGATLESLTSLDELAVPVDNPLGDFRQYLKKIKLGDLSMRGLGPRTIVWNFALMEDVEQIEQLAQFDSTQPIYIRSRRRDDTFGTFEVLMNWIEPREDGNRQPGFLGTRFEFVIEFTVLSEVDEGS